MWQWPACVDVLTCCRVWLQAEDDGEEAPKGAFGFGGGRKLESAATVAERQVRRRSGGGAAAEARAHRASWQGGMTR